MLEEKDLHEEGLAKEPCCLVDQRRGEVSSPYLTKTHTSVILTALKSGLLALIRAMHLLSPRRPSQPETTPGFFSSGMVEQAAE